MADTLNDIYTLGNDAAFGNRVRAAIMRVATDVIQAVNDNPSPTELEKRRRILAERVIQDRDAYTGHFTWILAARPGITGTITDSALVTAVNNAWNYLANLSA